MAPCHILWISWQSVRQYAHDRPLWNLPVGANAVLQQQTNSFISHMSICDGTLYCIFLGLAALGGSDTAPTGGCRCRCRCLPSWVHSFWHQQLSPMLPDISFPRRLKARSLTSEITAIVLHSSQRDPQHDQRTNTTDPCNSWPKCSFCNCHHPIVVRHWVLSLCSLKYHSMLDANVMATMKNLSVQTWQCVQ